MKQTKKMLIVEDHLTMIEGYKSILALHNRVTFDYFTARTYEEAVDVIHSAKSPFDVALLDISLNKGISQDELSGKNIGVLLRQQFPSTKIIIATSHIEKIILYDIYRAIKPESMLIKSDFGPFELIDALDQVLDNKPVYGDTFKNCVRDINEEPELLDSINQQIIFLIGQGIKTKNLPELLSLSVSTVDKRKAKIKEILGIEKGSDEDIIRLSKKRGLI